MEIFRTDQPLVPSWDLVRPSIRLVRENIWPVFYLNFLPGLMTTVGVVLAIAVTNPHFSTATMDTRTSLGLILALVGTLWSLLTYPGFLIFQIKAIAGEHPTAMSCFKQGIPRLLPFISMSVLGVFMVVMGFIALIVPGLILARGFYLAPYYVIDQKLDPVEALQKSFADSKPNAGYIWGTIGVTAAVGVVSSGAAKLPVIGRILGLCIGLTYVFAPALRYGEIAKNLPVRLDA